MDDIPALREGESAPRSAKPYLQAIKRYLKDFDTWRAVADRIDKIYSALTTLDGFGWDSGRFLGQEYNLYWASEEVIKPAVYSRAPVPVVTPKFKDRSPVKRLTAELLERSAISGFDQADINGVMLGVRDDTVILSRGVIWISYEDDGRERVCIEHLDRDDFAHDPVRKWCDVRWVARRAWLTQKEMRERFASISGDLYLSANYGGDKDAPLGTSTEKDKTAVWEFWDKDEEKVVWVSEGCDEVLDEDDPHLKLDGFFPCPEPAYGTRQRGSLVPVPDFTYIEDQLHTINELTVRIHDLCDKLVVKGIIPAGTDVGDAVEAAFREGDASHILIPVPSMSLTAGAGSLVEWLPIEQVAQTILASVEARREIIGNVQELLGVADIMRGDTQAQETLGAQQLKAQYGSARIRDRVNELVRIARDTVRIMAEIMAEEFSLDTLMKMAQMEIPTNADIRREIREVERAARQELEALTEQAEQMLQSPEAQQQDPEAVQQAQAQFQQQQQAIIAKYQPQIESLSSAVTQEAIKDLLDDSKTDPFIFDIETDSTVYPDEMAEKQSRNEFMTAFVSASQALAPLALSGPAGAKMAGELIKFQLGPYRAGRQLEGVIDEWIDSLEDMPQQSGQDDAAKQLAESQMALAQAELQKAQAQTMKVEADAQGKMQEMQLKAGEAQAKAQADQQRIALELEQTRGQIAETEARIQKVFAEIEAMGIRASNDTRQQDREDFKTVRDTQFRAEDQARAAEGQAFDQAARVQEGQRRDLGTDRNV